MITEQKNHKFEDLKELYNLLANEIFFYNQIRSCTPKKWKQKLELENINNIMYQNKTLLEKLQKSKQANKFLYNMQIKKQSFKKPKHQEKWEQELNNNEINWQNVYKNIYTSTMTIHSEISSIICATCRLKLQSIYFGSAHMSNTFGTT